MYLLRFDGFDVVGSSPEALVKVDGRPGAAAPDRRHPPARRDAGGGRRARRRAARRPKERAEHVMLVDLGRNDLGRVCEPGTVEVVDFMTRRALQPRHAHRLDRRRRGRAGARRAFDVLAACFPAGTLSGAPKVRAMEIIEELEPTRRGLYGGASATSTSPATSTWRSRSAPRCCATASRTSQAGAGLVADSDPAAEDAETPQQGARRAAGRRHRRRRCAPVRESMTESVGLRRPRCARAVAASARRAGCVLAARSALDRGRRAGVRLHAPCRRAGLADLRAAATGLRRVGLPPRTLAARRRWLVVVVSPATRGRGRRVAGVAHRARRGLADSAAVRGARDRLHHRPAGRSRSQHRTPTVGRRHGRGSRWSRGVIAGRAWGARRAGGGGWPAMRASVRAAGSAKRAAGHRDLDLGPPRRRRRPDRLRRRVRGAIHGSYNPRTRRCAAVADYVDGDADPAATSGGSP